MDKTYSQDLVDSDFDELPTDNLQAITREPKHLREQLDSLNEQTMNLTLDNYKTFLSGAECLSDIYDNFGQMESRADTLISDLPNLQNICKDFVKHARDIQSKRKLASVSLQRHPQLLEILEISQLMDTCVRNSYWDEALQLVSYVRRLDRKHSSIPLIAKLGIEVNRSFGLMLKQLLHQLEGNIQLPACLRIVGYLRRMDVFSELELRLKFLGARDKWFQGVLDAIPSEDNFTHIMKVIELSRIHLFDIITQFRAVFPDDDPLLLLNEEQLISETTVFQLWLHEKISQFLDTLETDLINLKQRMDSVINQCLYFGMSFSRVGADFRPMLLPLLQNVCLNQFICASNSALENFQTNLDNMVLPAHIETESAFIPRITEDVQAPFELTKFTSLAVFCNEITTALDELRACSPLSIAGLIADQLNLVLDHAIQKVIYYYKREEPGLTDDEKKTFEFFVKLFLLDMCPYFEKCLRCIFPLEELRMISGLSPSKFKKTGFSVDAEKFRSPLQELLPDLDTEASVPASAALELEVPMVSKDDHESQQLVSEKEVVSSQETSMPTTSDMPVPDPSPDVKPGQDETTVSGDGDSVDADN